MKVKYRKSLERAARQTILIQSSDTLIKLILRTIVTNIKVKHAGIFIYDKTKDVYVLKVSRGAVGFRIPPGFVKVSRVNPLIRYFTDKRLSFPKEAVFLEKINAFVNSAKVKKDSGLRSFLKELQVNLVLYQAKVCIPCVFRNDLIGVLFLGEKINKKKFVEEEIGFLSVLASNVVMALENAWLIEDLNRQLAVNKRLFVQTVAALVSSIEAKDKYTVGHTERVMQHCLVIAEKLKGKVRLEDWNKFKEDLRIAAFLHDIGKIGIPENILNKVSPLSEEEKKIMESHCLLGANILKNIEEFREVLLGVKYHHERYDGTGYPSHLKGKQIPLIAAVIALADTFDAMTVDRPYRQALSLAEALNRIKKGRGKQFAPAVVDAFLAAYKNKK